ncbi:MAG: hypothetical protein GTO14_05570, partial [Anaerolineales bacterium]|nr:hypothetical protein [Anaerolineales bacterium]
SPRTYNFNVNFWKELTPFRLNIVEHLFSWLPFSSSYPPLSYPVKRATIFILAIAVVAVFMYVIRNLRKQAKFDWLFHPGTRLNGYLLVFIFVFIAVFAFSYVFPYPPGRYSGRHYSPLKISLILIIFTLLHFYIQSNKPKEWLKILVLVISIATIISWAPTTLEFGQRIHMYGTAYTDGRWHNSETLEAVKNLPAELPIISNEVDLTLFFADRPAYRITELFHETRLDTFTRYGNDLEDQSQRLFREEGAALILFDTIEVQFGNIYYDKAQERLEAFVKDLDLYFDSGGGSIYFYPKP